MRWLIRVTAFFTVLAAIIFNLQLVMVQQQERPLGASETYTLTVVVKETSKEEILQSLQEISKEHQAQLVRPLLDTETGRYDLAWFGSSLPQHQQIDTGQETIYWLSDTQPGKVLPAGQLGEVPINGAYYLLSGASPALDEALYAWGQEKGIQVQQEKLETKPLLPLLVLFTTAIGNTLLALVVLLLSLLIAWTISSSKAQSMHLLVGQSPLQIQAAYLRKGGRWCLEGTLITILISGLYLLLAGYQPQLLIFLPPLLWAGLLALSVCLLLLGLVLFISRPSLVHMAQRTLPYQKFKWIGAFARLSVLALIMVIMPSTLALAISAYQYQQDQKVWENYRDLYTVSLKNIHSESELEARQDAIENYLKEIKAHQETYLAYGLKEAFLLEGRQLGDYEDIVLVSDSWLERQGGIHYEQKEDFRLQEIQASDFPDEVKPFLFGNDSSEGQLSLIVNQQKSLEESFTYYSYEGKPLFIPGLESAYGGDIHFYEKALLIVVDDPMAELSPRGFVIPAMSSGNIFFSGKDNLEEYAQQTGFDYFVFAIDSFSQLGLEILEEYRQHFRYYLLSLFALSFALLFTSYQSAAIWASVYKKRIFTLRTSGQGYPSLIRAEIIKELGLATLILLLFALCRLLTNPTLALEIGLVLLASLLAFTLALYLNFLARAKASFTQVSQRK